MKILEVKVIYESDDIEKYKKKIADIFYDLGVTGLKIEEPLLNKNPLDFYKDEKEFLMENNAISAYFPLNIYTEKRKIFISERLNEEFSEVEDMVYTLNFYEYDEEDYQNNWKQYLFPEKVSKRFVVKPTWRDYEKEEDEIVIELDPGRAFGTGSHPTTALCLELIEENIKQGDSVIDIGTGSGILMIAAEKLGASIIYGTDIDELAIEVANENLDLNNIDMSKIKLLRGDLLSVLDGEKFDVVVANILADVLLLLLNDIAKLIKPKSKIIFSGIIEDKCDEVVRKVEELGMTVKEVRKLKEWNALLIEA